MTGVFITGMSIPKNCGRCPLSILTHEGWRECFITKCDVTYYIDWHGRHEFCPMEEKDIEEEE